MLQKQQRLTTKEFDHYYQTGRRLHGQYVGIIYNPSDEFHGAVVVGKKVFSKAHDRNRMRRRLYGILYAQKVAKSAKGVYIVLVKPTAKNAPYQAVRDELTSLLTKLS
ncbi:ribonuclease P protein component [Candidatus Nomurabacteria bacterium]|nr:ribonuclease P protein component [Candidatus Nomurabacteria bacterium]